MKTLKKVKVWLVFIPFLIQVLFIHSCGQSVEPDKKMTSNTMEESLLKANKQLVKTEDQQINDFISRYGWKMNETGTGLRYLIYQNGKGDKVIKGNKVTLGYSVSLLSGEVCYSSEKSGNKIFVVGQGGVETGLEEGILFLKKDDRAKIILPSHLAFGLVGDGDKIPAKATLVYDVELLEIK
jgi:FKBP-type peptidyl-prolyl cis-trans isomerase